MMGDLAHRAVAVTRLGIAVTRLGIGRLRFRIFRVGAGRDGRGSSIFGRHR
jgi:hypothetical protein